MLETKLLILSLLVVFIGDWLLNKGISLVGGIIVILGFIGLIISFAGFFVGD